MRGANRRESRSRRGSSRGALRLRRSATARGLLLAGTTCLLACVAVLGACGGGGGGGAQALEPVTIDLGLQSATLPTPITRSFRNPLGGAADVIPIISEASAFSMPADRLPTGVPGQGNTQLTILFTPAGPGVQEGLITLRWTSGGETRDEPYLFRATGEPVLWNFDEPDFGAVLVDEQRELTVQVTNDSGGSPVTLTSADVPRGFALLAPTLPVTIASRDSIAVEVRFTPTAVDTYDGTLLLGRRDPGGNIRILMRGSGTRTGEQIIDLGAQTLTGGVTDPIDVVIPADAVSVAFEAYGPTSSRIGLESLTGPGSKVYESSLGTGPVRWFQTSEAFAARIPADDRSDTALVPGGGTYTVQFAQLAGSATSFDVRAIVERRPPGASTARVLDLNIWTSPAVGVPASAAPTDTTLQATLTQMDAILAPVGVRIGDVDYYDIGLTAYDDVSQAEVPGLLAESAAATEDRLNIFLVQRLFGGQLLGLSQAIGGTVSRGTASSGVISVYVNLTANQAAAVLTHECGHYLGLWHTTESNGTYDRMNDTLECPVFGAGNGCATAGGGYLMHWQALGGTTLSNGQGRILADSPLLRADLGGQAKPGALRVPRPLTRAEREGLAWPWCGSAAPPRR